MNARLYDSAAQLPAPELDRDRGAFFGSILGTLNHIAITDIIWLQRLSAHPSHHRSLDPIRARHTPQSLRETLQSDLASLRALRTELDEIIVRRTHELREVDLDHVLEYRNTKGIPAQRRFGPLALHLFKSSDPSSRPGHHVAVPGGHRRRRYRSADADPDRVMRQ